MPKLTDQQYKALVTAMREALAEVGFSATQERPVPFGLSLMFAGGGMLTVYNGKKGASVVSGGALTERERATVEEAAAACLAAQQGTPQVSATGQAAAKSHLANLTNSKAAWAGSDESGKGDFFGPLVVAAVGVRPEQLAQLEAKGIRDSKLLSNTQALELSGWIERELPHSLQVLLPDAYNAEYAKVRNLNLILADLHARALAAVCQQTGAQAAITDEYGNPTQLRRKLVEYGCNARHFSRVRGEADAAVAAASILARGVFLQSLRDLSVEATIDLPPGAGPQVIRAGREFVGLFGREELTRYAKLHFKTLESL